MVKTLAGGATRAAAQARTEALARATRRAEYDPKTDTWWGKSPDALHEFRLVDGPLR